MSEGATTELATVPQTTKLLMPVASPQDMIERHNSMTTFLKDSLQENRDYGAIPGTGERMTLLKPGAELILIGFGCVAVDEIAQSDADHNAEIKFELKKWVEADIPKLNGKQDQSEVDRLKAAGTHRFTKKGDKWAWQEAMTEAGIALGFYRYVVRTKIIHRASGEVVGSGIGSCSTAESKYIRAPRDAENTVLKMAKKRALIDAVLNTFALSERFSQDMDDLIENKEARVSGEQTPDQESRTGEPKQPAKTPEQIYWDTHHALKLPPHGATGKYSALNIQEMNTLIGSGHEVFESISDDEWVELTRRIRELSKEDIAAWKAGAVEVAS